MTMTAGRRPYLRAALAALLASHHPAAVDATTFVCGSDYNDASINCTVNPACPSGDGCPDDKGICFAMPDDQCMSPPTTPGPTVEPSAGPTPAPLRVCGTDYTDALSGCRSNAYCPGGDGSLCPMGTACFSIPVNICPTDAPTMAPTPVPRVCGADYAAARANCLDLTKRCPTGDGCATGEACFNVPGDQCGVPEPTLAVTASPVAPDNTPPEPTVAPTDSAPAEPTVSPTPDPFLKVCGANYTDASTGCRTNPVCPTGDGCPTGTTCFALPRAACPESTTTPEPTTSSPVAASTTPAPTPNPSPEPTTASPTAAAAPKDPTASPTPAPSSAGPTPSPSDPPVYNRFFCGVTYAEAEANCWTAEPCPSGFGCSKDGEACFGIAAERCLSPAPTDAPTGPGPQPTDGPTMSSTPTNKPTMSSMPTPAPTDEPTKSPTINVFFCGMTYDEAVSNCSEGTACPTGSCPGGMNCYNGIQCADSAGDTPAPTPSPQPPTTSRPTTELEGIFGGGGNPSPTPPTYERYCGFSVDDAMDNCAINVACPDGLSSVCPMGQTCFPIPEACGTAPGPTPVTPSPTDKPIAYNINSPNFCGFDFNDALANCFQRAPCPSGYEDECPTGQGCFPVTECLTAPPTTSPSPTIKGGVAATSSPSKSPTKQPITPKPSFNLDDFNFSPGESGRNASCMLGSGTLFRTLMAGGAVLVALVL